MRPSLAHLFQTTTFRLGVVQATAVLVVVILLLSYVYVATSGQLLADADAAADAEFEALERVYSEGGMRGLTEEVIRRSSFQQDLLYLLADADGAIVAGSLRVMPADAAATAERVDFTFERPSAPGVTPAEGRARGRLGRLLGGPILVVASDLDEATAITRRLTRVLFIFAILGVALAVGAGLLAARQAARRAEALSTTARRVMAGDLSSRAPVQGVGDEFDQLAGDINEMLDWLERLVHATRTAGDAIAHDLRSPLTRSRQRIERALALPPDSAADREALAKVKEESDKLLSTFDAVLRLARVESEASLRLERVSYSAIAADIADLYDPVAEARGITMETSVEGELLGRGDAELICQALSNLAENALKFTPSGGRVRIEARARDAAHVEVSVSDDGPGVPPQERENVFGRFVRLQGSRTTPGVGLGLSLVDAIVRVHRGAIVLEDGIGDSGSDRPGLTARLILPREEAS